MVLLFYTCTESFQVYVVHVPTGKLRSEKRKKDYKGTLWIYIPPPTTCTYNLNAG